MLVLIVALAMVAPASADPWIGGDPLVTANGTSGVVSGGLWFDAYSDFESAYPTPIVHNFTPLPCDPEDIAWARLYVDSYIGNMQNNYPLNTTVEFDGGSGYVLLGSEIMNTTYTFPMGSGTGTVWINDHSTRVTSDHLMWYDVKDEITSSNVAARVHTARPDGGQPFDGRVKMITLIVAYNDGDYDQIHYWVNQGHDTDSYVADDWGYSYVGETDFSTSGITSPINANLTAIYLASYNGNYTFNNNSLPWSNPQQGPYFGHQSWDVTSYITGGDSTMTFDRNATHAGQYSGYFKIPLALLTVEEEE
ncbi:DUF3344 domain-containing protein [Methanoculleus palmolei]|uniref:DUF3344 domain-containing protein n=1 Tax=Methanoculleus palmolei TaxID=72612 RepID=A0ABD8A7L3_9EURY|nr:DUF3344 domain-containing protein [Methanoculleus palmolei]